MTGKVDDMGLIRCYGFLLTSTPDILCVDTCLVFFVFLVCPLGAIYIFFLTSVLHV